MMDMYSIIVSVIGVGLIVFILRYFLSGPDSIEIATIALDQQHVRIRVKGGYEPALVVLRRGVPAVLEFFRDEEDSCSERVVLHAFNKSAFLPAHESTRVEFTPDRTGKFAYNCGMGMLTGEILVKEA
ncbi:cupredoxin domain-containing protein [bacterium]|nr:cupredoxin domain-containing protein [bacterium]